MSMDDSKGQISETALDGEDLESSGGGLQVSGEDLRLGGEDLKPSGEGLQVSGEDLRLGGEGPKPSSEASQVSGEDSQLSGADLEWVSTPEEGWSSLPMADAVRRNNFVSGDSSGKRLTVEYFRHDADGSLRAKVIFGPAAQGPPGHAHGGSMAAVLDEAMGAAAWVAGHMVVAAELTTRFKGMLPLGTRCVVEGRVDSVEGRRVRVSGFLCNVDGQVFSEGEAIFVKLREDQIQRLAGIGTDNFFASASEKGGRDGHLAQDQQSSSPGGGPLA